MNTVTCTHCGHAKVYCALADCPQQIARDESEKDRRIAELEARLRPGVSEMLNELIAAGMAHVNPVSGELSFTPQGKLLIERTRDFEHRSGSNN